MQARCVSFRYGGEPVLRAIDLDVPAGSCSLIQGDNGAGKSTLLQLLQGVLSPCSGTVLHRGRPLQGRRRYLALVPQSAALQWHYPIDVRGLVALAAGTDRSRAERALRQVGLEAQARRSIARLSGGQRQRALIARALAQGCDVLLLDEPLAALDALSRERLGSLLQQLLQLGTAVVFSAHGELPASFPPLRRYLLNGGILQACSP